MSRVPRGKGEVNATRPCAAQHTPRKEDRATTLHKRTEYRAKPSALAQPSEVEVWNKISNSSSPSTPCTRYFLGRQQAMTRKRLVLVLFPLPFPSLPFPSSLPFQPSLPSLLRLPEFLLHAFIGRRTSCCSWPRGDVTAAFPCVPVSLEVSRASWGQMIDDDTLF